MLWIAPVSASAGTSSGEISVSRIEVEQLAGAFVELPGGDRPADQVLDQRLGHPGVDGVVAHLVADAVGAPAERQLGEVAGADDEPAVLVGQAEQIVGAQARLHVLEGDVVDRLAAAKGWPMSSSICSAAGRMSISAASTPSAFISAQALALVASPVAKPGMV